VSQWVGQAAEEALRKTEALALRAIAERLEHGEAAPLPIRIGLHAA